MVQRSAGNPTGRGARRRFDGSERAERVAPWDEPHVRLGDEQTARQRYIAIQSGKAGSLVIGALCIGWHTPVAAVIGGFLLTVHALIPWPKGGD